MLSMISNLLFRYQSRQFHHRFKFSSGCFHLTFAESLSSTYSLAVTILVILSLRQSLFFLIHLLSCKILMNIYADLNLSQTANTL